jgi:signal transduction histidine kinase
MNQTTASETYVETSIALISPDGELIDWNQGFAREFEEAKNLLKTGSSFFEMVELVSGDLSAEFVRTKFGQERTYRTRSERLLVNVNESLTAVGNVLRVAVVDRRNEGPAERSTPQLERAVIRAADGMLALRRKAQEEVVQAKEAAEQSNAAKSQFVAMVNHELRTPLQGIVGMSSLLSQTSLTATQQEYLHAIETSGQLLLALIDDILEVSHIEQGKLEIHVSEFNLRELSENCRDLLELRAEQKGVKLKFSWEEAVPVWVKSDPLRLRQILFNLIGNSIKFTERRFGGTTN